jgi:hypothetical protein
MESILHLLRRVWLSEEAEDARLPTSSDEQDRSSLADFVRILQAQDQVETSDRQ